MLKRSVFGRLVPVLFAIVATAVFVPAALAAPTAIEVGGYASCALDSGAAYCWSGSTATRTGDRPYGAPSTSSPTLFPGLTSGVTDISTGYRHACAVVNGGGVCFGTNDDLQLGDPDYYSSKVPIPVKNLSSGVTDIAAGNSFSCAVVSAAVKCWGASSGTSLGYSSDYSPLPAAVPGLTSGVTAVDAGDEMACAIVSGAARCWGFGYLGDGINHGSNALVTVSGLIDSVTDIEVSGTSACAIRLGALKCWGTGAGEYTGQGSTTPAATPIIPTGLGSNVTAVSVGDRVICAVVSGAVKCWGTGIDGELGGGGFGDAPTPVAVPGVTTGATDVGTTYFASCAIVSGAVKCWGTNEDGMLGDGVLLRALTPTSLPALASGVTDISAGYGASCAVVSGTGKCWGNLTSPTVGYGSDGFESASPATVGGLESGVTDIDVDTYGCAVVSTAVKCWDSPDGGNPVATPITGGESGASSVDVNDRNGCALIASGVRCGLISDPVDRALAPVTGVTSGVTQVASGYSHNCAIVSGAAKCWGTNYYGELGATIDSDFTDVPQQVVGLTSGVTAITAGSYFSCAVVNGAAKCWGSGGYAELGDGQLTDSQTPVQVEGLTSGVTAISASSYHACAIKAGDVYCWGVGSDGELGNNTRLGSTIPEKTLSLPSTVTQVSAGWSHTCAIADGGAYCWGANSQGQLGMGTTFGARTPTSVAVADGAPSVGFIKPIDGSFLKTDSTPVSVASANATTVECKLDQGAWGACPSSYTNLSQGDHKIRVYGENAIGQLAIADTYFSVDSVGPKVTIVSPANGSTVNTNTPALYFNIDDDYYSYVECTLDGVTLLDEWGDPDYCDSITKLPPLTIGAHTLVVTAYDDLGNAGSTTSIFNYAAATTPTMSTPSTKATLSGKARKSGKSLKVGYVFSFPAPAGSNPAVACSGSVKVTAKYGKKKSSKTSALRVGKSGCVATASFKLPRSTRGKKVSFDAYFYGNSLMLPAHNVTKLKIKS